MNLVSARNTDTAERDVADIRLKNDEDLKEIYEFGRKLGQGSFGAVYRATHIETQTKWAIKEVFRPAAGSSKVEMVDNEIKILKQVNHAHIIHLEAIYTSAMMIYLVTELCEGGDLKQLLQQKKFFTEDETRHIIFCLADAVVYLHKRDIVHRDLKLENILVKNSPDEDDVRFDIKVADFGLSAKTRAGITNILTEACGTVIYMAPEMMSGRGYSHWCDVWSIGVIMYILLCGEPPFVSRTKEKLLEKIMNKEVRFTQPAWAKVSEEAKYLLTCLLKADPAYRMSAHQLLENPWITGDTTVPFVTTNVLELMNTYLEHEGSINKGPETKKDSSFMSSEDTPEPPLDTKEGKNPVGNSFSCSRTTSNETSHIGEKRSTQRSAKARRCQDKKNLSVGQKPTSDSRRVEEERGSSNGKGLVPANQQRAKSLILIQNKTKQDKERAKSQEKN